jgi:hypothetical protein
MYLFSDRTSRDKEIYFFFKYLSTGIQSDQLTGVFYIFLMLSLERFFQLCFEFN